MNDLVTSLEQWQSSWDDALLLWSRYTQLRNPIFCNTHAQASKHGLNGSFAMIRLKDQSVVIDLQSIAKYKLQDYAVEILAHEIGHHIFSPATLTDHARMIARIHVCLPTLESQASMVANLYSDLLINNHLQKQFGLRMDEVYRKMDQVGESSKVWQLYMRIYEHLWQLKPGELGGHTDGDAMEGDAWLGARIIKVYAQDWLKGASRFASLLLPYLVQEKDIADQFTKLMDTKAAGKGLLPSGLIQKDEGENDNIHPSVDPELVGEQLDGDQKEELYEETSQSLNSKGQCREPFEYGEILKSAGINLSDHEIAARYYKERAIPLLVSFPSSKEQVKTEQIPEGTQLWEPGEPIEDVDWFSSLALSRHIIPGVTTLKREWGFDEGDEPDVKPYDLDLYVDCSGSMPNPQRNTSFTTLAGAILCLSALRAGANVQVTLWSGKNQFKTTNGFVKSEAVILSVLTDYLGGATAFPIHVLRKTHIETKRQNRSHVVILSDDGVTTLFDNDELGNSGWDISRQALENAKGGGTMVLNLNWDFPSTPKNNWMAKYDATLKKAQLDQCWDIYPVSSWEAMVDFAKTFSKKHFERGNHE